MKKVSIYENAFEKAGITVSLDDVLFADKWRIRVERLRKIKNAEKKNEAKLQMPMFTVSGVFSQRSKNGLVEHSGMICLDVDGKDNPNLDISDFIQSMRYVDEVYYAGYSVSGQGCFIVMPISEPENHEFHFDALVKDFQRMGVNIDKSCRDVSRTRFVSYNPNPYFNPNAKEYDKLLLPKPIQRIRYSDTNTNVARLADKVIRSGINITESYRDWFALACSLRGVNNGRAIFHSLSSMDARYKEHQAEYQFDAVDANGGYDKRKFFEICKRHNIYLKQQCK